MKVTPDLLEFFSGVIKKVSGNDVRIQMQHQLHLEGVENFPGKGPGWLITADWYEKKKHKYMAVYFENDEASFN